MRKNVFGDKLRKLRKEKDLTLNELAKELGISLQHLSNFENGRRIPRLETFRKIAQFFNIDYNELLDIPENIEKEMETSLKFSDENSDRFLADSLYYNDPGIVEDAIRQKQGILKEKGINYDLECFMNKRFEDQIMEVLSLILGGRDFLLGAMEKMALNYIADCIKKNNIEDLSRARKALEEFLRKFPNDKRENFQSILSSFQTLYELSCQIEAYRKNEEKADKKPSAKIRVELEQRGARIIPIKEARKVLLHPDKIEVMAL
jgi:transcriptional regulator with XRE-family HTH domain